MVLRNLSRAEKIAQQSGLRESAQTTSSQRVQAQRQTEVQEEIKTASPSRAEKLRLGLRVGAGSFANRDVLPGERSGAQKSATFREAGLTNDRLRGGNDIGGFSAQRASETQDKPFDLSGFAFDKTPQTTTPKPTTERQTSDRQLLGAGFGLNAEEQVKLENQSLIEQRAPGFAEEEARKLGTGALTGEQDPSAGVPTISGIFFSDPETGENITGVEQQATRSGDSDTLAAVELVKKFGVSLATARDIIARSKTEESLSAEEKASFRTQAEENVRLKFEEEQTKGEAQTQGRQREDQKTNIFAPESIINTLSPGLTESNTSRLESAVTTSDFTSPQGQTDFMSLFTNIETKQRQQDETRLAQKQIDVDSKLEALKDERKAQDAELDAQAKTQKREATERSEERLDNAKRQLNAAGRLTTDNEGNLDAEAVALLDSIESDARGNLNDELIAIDEKLSSAKRTTANTAFNKRIEFEDELTAFEDARFAAQEAREASFNQMILKNALETDQPKFQALNTEDGVVVFDPRTGRLRIPTIEGQTAEDKTKATMSALLSSPLSFNVPTQLVNSEAELKNFQNIVKEEWEKNPDLSDIDLREIISKKILGFDFNTDGQQAFGDSLRSTMLQAPDEVQTKAFYNNVAELIRKGDEKGAVDRVERELLKSIDPTLERQRFYNNTIDTTNQILTLIDKVPDKALGKFEGNVFRLSRDILAEEGGFTKEERNATTRLEGLLTSMFSDWRRANAGTAVTPSELEFLKPLIADIGVDRNTLLTQLNTFVDSGALSYNNDRSAVGLPDLAVQQATTPGGQSILSLQSPLELYSGATQAQIQTTTPATQQTQQTQSFINTPKENIKTEFTPQDLESAGLGGFTEGIRGLSAEDQTLFGSFLNSDPEALRKTLELGTFDQVMVLLREESQKKKVDSEGALIETGLKSVIGGQPVRVSPGTAPKLTSVQRDLQAQGIDLKIADSFRSTEVQRKAFESGKEGVAEPGKSFHETGDAIDLSQTGGDNMNNRVVFDALRKAGFKQHPGEWWHWSIGEFA